MNRNLTLKPNLMLLWDKKMQRNNFTIFDLQITNIRHGPERGRINNLGGGRGRRGLNSFFREGPENLIC